MSTLLGEVSWAHCDWLESLNLNSGKSSWSCHMNYHGECDRMTARRQILICIAAAPEKALITIIPSISHGQRKRDDGRTASSE